MKDVDARSMPSSLAQMLETKEMKKYLFCITSLLAIILISVSCQHLKKQNDPEVAEEVIPLENDEDNDLKILNSILEQLKLKQEDCYSRFISSEVVPNHEQLTIWVIPRTTFYEKDEYGHEAFNVQNYVLLADTETGKVVSKYYSPYELGSDAYELLGISIDTLNYQLNKAKVLFGVSWMYRASTRVCPTGNGVMELFVQQGDSLQRIFNYDTYSYHGENDGGFQGNSYMEYYGTKIIVLDKVISGYSDFALLTECTTDVTENNENIKNEIESDSLRFFSYTKEGYKEVKNYTDIFCLPSVEEKTNCIYFNKTLSEVYQIIYKENKDGLQRYMRAELPTKTLGYAVKYDGEDYTPDGEKTDSMYVDYNYLDDKHLNISFGTEIGGELYTLEDKGNRIILKYNYHD